MIARVTSPILLLFLSQCLLPILNFPMLGGVASASVPSEYGLKSNLSTRRRQKIGEQTSSVAIELSGGESDTAVVEKSSTGASTTKSDEILDTDSLSDSHSMGSPESIKLKPRVISLNIMVAGLAGLGKTTLCRALLDAWWEEIQEDKGDSSGNKDKINEMAQRLGSLASSVSSSLSQVGSSTPTRTIPSVPARRTMSTTAISPSAPFEYFDEKANTILRVRIIDTPGFGNRVNHRNSVKPITDYISECRRKRFLREKAPSFKQSEGDDDANNRMLVHVCLYFLSPGRFLAIDRHFLKHVQNEVTVVPVIAKADTMTDDEIARYRAELTRIWEDESIDVYSLDQRNDHKFKFGRSSTRPNGPNVARSKTESYYRGRRPGEVLAIISRDGMYPWGDSCALDPEHSDLKLIRDSLLSEHTERFLELAAAKYKAYRDAQLAKEWRSEAIKYLAIVGLAAVQLGRLEIKGTKLRDVVAKGMTTVAPMLERVKESPKLQALVASIASIRPKKAEAVPTEETEVSEPPKKKGFRLFRKASSDSNKSEKEETEAEPPKRKKRRFPFGLSS